MQGGIPLQGKVRIQGSKNAALPILAATLLTNEVSYIQNCPRIADVHCFVHLLRELGCLVHWQEKGIRVQPGENEELPCERAEARRMQGEAITGMRSSLCLLGALLGRCGYVTMEHPGGCIIGERPIDLHIRALQQMGVEFREEEGLLSAQVKDGKMHGAEITLEFPSVGATENILLAAVKADGDTRILGAAREPEVTALCEFLTACGAQIEGIGETELLVHGDRPLHGTQFTVPADRIVAGTYLFACIGCGGSTLLTEAPWEQMEAVTFVAEKMGAQCIASEEGLFVQCSKRPQAIPHLRTGPYPEFPTDLQSVAMAVLTRAEGCSCIEENIFENRFRIAEPLKGMGAEIVLKDGRHAVITGVEHRRAIWLAASRAAFCDPILSEYYQSLRARGKHHLTAIGAVSRKLCNIIFAILSENRLYETVPPREIRQTSAPFTM